MVSPEALGAAGDDGDGVLELGCLATWRLPSLSRLACRQTGAAERASGQGRLPHRKSTGSAWRTGGGPTYLRAACRTPSASLLPERFRRLVREPRLGAADAPARPARQGARAAAPSCSSRRPAPARRSPGSCRASSSSRSGDPARARPRTSAALHTLYISPLKALAIDIARNLEAPVREMGLPVRIETRTGDTPSHKRARQIERPPDILLTTPEQLALLLAHREARELLQGSAPGGARRTAFPRHLEARRSPVARPGAAVHDRARRRRRSASRRRCASRTICGAIWCRSGTGPLPLVGERWRGGCGSDSLSAYGAAPPSLRLPHKGEGIGTPRRSRRGAGRRAARYPHARARRAPAARRAHGVPVDAGDLRPHPRGTRRRWSSSTRACRRSTRSRNCGSSTTTGSPSRSITAPSTCRSAAGSRRR